MNNTPPPPENMEFAMLESREFILPSNHHEAVREAINELEPFITNAIGMGFSLNLVDGITREEEIEDREGADEPPKKIPKQKCVLRVSLVREKEKKSKIITFRG